MIDRAVWVGRWVAGVRAEWESNLAGRCGQPPEAAAFRHNHHASKLGREAGSLIIRYSQPRSSFCQLHGTATDSAIATHGLRISYIIKVVSICSGSPNLQDELSDWMAALPAVHGSGVEGFALPKTASRYRARACYLVKKSISYDAMSNDESWAALARSASTQSFP